MRKAFLGALALLALAAPPAEASDHRLAWQDCDDGFQCATAKVPLDYDHPHGRMISLALIRFRATDQAHRIGSVFIHPGGSGGAGVRFVRTAPPQALALLGRRFDIVGVDTRGVGASRPAMDCDADPEQLGVYPQPFPRPETLDARAFIANARAYARRCFERSGELLGHMSSADMARDFDTLRALVGDKQLTSIGNSYGSLVGATYASLFPGRARALALTAPVDADTWINRPFEAIREQTAAIEHGLHRYFASVSVTAEDEFLDLAARLDRTPLPGAVDGDDLRLAAFNQMLSPRRWPALTAAIKAAQAGDGSQVRALADAAYERTPAGDSPAMDVLWATLANDQHYPRTFEPFLAGGRHSASLFDISYFNSGYGELAFAALPVEPQDGFAGPFRNAPGATPALVIGTTHDTFTPHQWAPRLVSDLGNARLVTFRGDGHDVLTNFNPCVISTLLAYLEDLTVPPAGKECS